MKLGDDADRTTQWEAWWDANRELYYKIPRAAWKEEGSDNGSKTVFGDQMRKKAIEALTKVLQHDDDRGARLQAVIALAKVGDEKVVDAIVRSMEKDSAREVRVTATYALGLTGAATAEPHLLKILRDRRGDSIQQAYAGVALGFVGCKAIDELCKKVFQPRLDTGVQLGILLGMSKLSGKKVVDTLARIAMYTKGDKLVRAMAVRSLGFQDAKMAIPVFQRLVSMRKDDKFVQQATAMALAHQKSPKAIQLLRHLIVKRKDDYTRAFALLSLGHHKDKKQVGFLIDGLKQAPYQIRAFVALACGIQGDAKAIPAVRKFVKKYHSQKSYYAAGCIALGMLGDKDMTKGMIKQISRSKKADFLPYAITAVGLAGDKKVAKQLMETVKEQARDTNTVSMGTIALIKLEKKGIIEALTKTMHEGNSFERRAAAQALGETASRDVVEALCKEATKGDDKSTRAAAARALGHVMDKSLEYGSSRWMSFAFHYRTTPLNRALWHIFALP